jgi:hypothetical protein
MGAEAIQRGVSDYIRGRGLGSPCSLYRWSLTARIGVGARCRTGAKRVGRTERRPTTTARNLREAGHLFRGLTASKAHAMGAKNPLYRVI